MTSPNDAGRDDEQRDGQDSATSTPAEEQDQQTSAASSEQASAAEASSSEQAEGAEAAKADTTESAAPEGKTEAKAESAAQESETEAKAESAVSKTEGAESKDSSEVSADDHASGLGEELAQDVEKKKTGLLIGVAAAVVVVLVALGVGAYFLFFASPSAQNVAQGYADVSNKETQDPASVTVDDYKPYVCSKAMPQIEAIQKQKEMFLKQAKPQDLEMLKQVHTSVKNVSEQGDTGKVVLEQTVPGQGAQQLNLNLIQEDGWKLCA